MKSIKPEIILSLITVLISFSCNGHRTIKWWSSSSAKLWEEQRNIFWQDSALVPGKPDAVVYLDSLRQNINGFGGTISELGWQAILSATPKKRDKALNDLFLQNSGGLRFGLVRMPVGANGFATGFYTPDDSAYDFNLDFFSLDRDKKNIIPFLNAAMELNPHLKIWACPWSPPAWMKMGAMLRCKPMITENSMKHGISQTPPECINSSDSVLSAYAKYLTRFIKEYKEEDINISSIIVQNECNTCTGFPSCRWCPETLSAFVGRYFGPQLSKNKIGAQLWLGAFNNPAANSVDTVLLKNGTVKYTSGIALSGNGYRELAVLAGKYPKMGFLAVNPEINNGKNNWQGATETFHYISNYLNNGANAFLYGNLVIDETGAGPWGYTQNSLITIDKKRQKVIYNPDYFVLKHFSGNIPQGSRKVAVSGSLENIMAFLAPDNDLIIVIANFKDKTHKVCIEVEDKFVTFAMQPNSINSLLCFNIR